MKDIPESALAATLDRLILCFMLLALAGVLTAAMSFQYLDGEIPCPLCLLERVAMFACCFGLIRQLRDGGSQRGAGIAMISAVLLLWISVRQTLLISFHARDTPTSAPPSLVSTWRYGPSSSR